MTGISNILIANDLTDRSERAVERAVQICREGHAEKLTFVHVIARGLLSGLADQQQKGAEAFLADRVARLPSLGVSQPVCFMVRIGEPFSTIIAEAIAEKADLVVLGAPSRPPYPQMFVGTTAERVIRFGERPVLLVNQPTRGPYDRVLVAFDGSEGAVRSLTAALLIAPAAEFRIVHAWWPPRASFGESEEARNAIEKNSQQMREMISSAAEQAAAASNVAGSRLTINMVEANPYVAISNEAAWADLLVIGTHSKGRLATTLSIGRLALRLFDEFRCDVLTSRP